jgi:thymidine kinase
MMRSYLVAKAAGADHTQALQMIVQTWYGRSPLKAHAFWNNYCRNEAGGGSFHYVAPNKTKDEADMKGFVYCLILDEHQFEDHGDSIIDHMEEIYNRLKTEFSPR